MPSLFHRVRLFATPWTVARQAPLSIGFSWQEYWSGFAISSSRGSSPPRIKPMAGQRFPHCRWTLHHGATQEATYTHLCPWSALSLRFLLVKDITTHQADQTTNISVLLLFLPTSFQFNHSLNSTNSKTPSIF